MLLEAALKLCVQRKMVGYVANKSNDQRRTLPKQRANVRCATTLNRGKAIATGVTMMKAALRAMGNLSQIAAQIHKAVQRRGLEVEIEEAHAYGKVRETFPMRRATCRMENLNGLRASGPETEANGP